jgi:thymidine kinase
MAKLYFYYASMNAGKSTTLLQADFNYRERGMATMLYTAAIDERAGRGVIASRLGVSAPATPFDAGTDLLAGVLDAHARAPVACVLIDEAQFLTPTQVDQLAQLADAHGIPVLCYGLRTDFLGHLFPGSARLLGLADALIEIKSVCRCGRKATMNLRVDERGQAIGEGRQTDIGGNERYVALCRRHFTEALRGRHFTEAMHGRHAEASGG